MLFSDSQRYYYDYECNEPLVANAKLTATSSLRDRGPENAKLYGEYGQSMKTLLTFTKEEFLLYEAIFTQISC